MPETLDQLSYLFVVPDEEPGEKPMMMCEPHWEKLRQAIKDRGMWHMVARSGAEAAAKAVAESAQGQSLENFDPLMGAHNMIVKHAMNAAGMALFQPNEDGTERCPICYLTAEHLKICKNPDCGQDFEQWIVYAADGAKQSYDQAVNQ